MAKCIKCGNGTFEVTENTPRNSNFKLLFVQCTSCGGVVSALESFNIGSMLHKLAKRLGVSLD